jgi:hypothetical protein
MAIYIYKVADGSLYSWAPNDSDPVADDAALAAAGLAKVAGLAPLDPTHAWDATTKTVIVVAAASAPNLIATWKFVMLFTPAEHAAIAASADQKVQQFMMAVQVAQTIDLNDPVVQAGINYLASISLLTQANATLILSGQASQ